MNVKKMIVDLFIPCFIDHLYPDTANNMVKILENIGCSVHYNFEQTCCGQPAFNAGHFDSCKEVGQKFIKDFPNDRYIVSPSASCVGMVKNYYPEMFHNSALHNEYKQIQKNIFEFSDFMVNILKITDLHAKLEAKAVYMDSCSALRECGIRKEPRVLLEKVRGLKLLELKNPETCCGFGGTFAVKNESISVAMAAKKIEDALSVGAEYIISTDASCLMHLDSLIQQNNINIKTIHIIDVLATGVDFI